MSKWADTPGVSAHSLMIDPSDTMKAVSRKVSFDP
jgi:hypothetical protein